MQRPLSLSIRSIITIKILYWYIFVGIPFWKLRTLLILYRKKIEMSYGHPLGVPFAIFEFFKYNMGQQASRLFSWRRTVCRNLSTVIIRIKQYPLGYFIVSHNYVGVVWTDSSSLVWLNGAARVHCNGISSHLDTFGSRLVIFILFTIHAFSLQLLYFTQ